MLLIKFIYKLFPLLCLFTAFIPELIAQPAYEQGYFSPPLSIPMRLSGNFGEIRPGHFHSGLDIKTDSTIGKAVLAAADGYIYRIKVSSAGFGKAIYMNHANGLVTVYGHLHHFTDSMEQFTQLAQYQKESFDIELFPDSNQFRFKKGDLIAWSGNTGGSQGPHLHFEIRDAKTEKPINPLLFGFPITDTIPPILESLLFKSVENLKNKEKPVSLVYKLINLNSDPDTLILSGLYQLAFKGFDRCINEPNQFGIFEITLFADNKIIYHFKQTTFAFDETRYANASIDFEENNRNGEIFQRCYRLPCDFFSLHEDTSQHAIIEVIGDKMVQLKLVLTDYHQNTTEKIIYLNPTVKMEMKNSKTTTNSAQIYKKAAKSNLNWITRPILWNKKNTIKTSGLLLEIPKGALYDNEQIKFAEIKSVKTLFNQEKQFTFEKITPLHIPAKLTLWAPGFPDSLKSKALIALINEKQKPGSAGGQFKGDSISTTIRNLGTFAILADTVKPIIENYVWVTDTLFKTNLLTITISDNLSGIASFRSTLNGTWLLMEYDEKTSTLFHAFPDIKEAEGKLLYLEVADKKQNKTIYETIIN